MHAISSGSSGGKSADLSSRWFSTDGRVEFDNRQLNIVTFERKLFPSWQECLIVPSTVLIAGFVFGVIRGVVTVLNCRDKVPRLHGEPTEIYSLDNSEHLTQLGLKFQEGESKADYYIRSGEGTWTLVERKEGQSHPTTALQQAPAEQAGIKLELGSNKFESLIRMASKPAN